MEMMKLLKILGWLVGILVVLVVALVLLAPLLIDPNDHKDRIIAEVRQATGRDLSIGGDIGLSVFPWLGLELNGLSMSNPPGFAERQFASVEQAKVRVKLMPLLLDRTLEADTVQIEGLNLYLAKNSQGQANWEGLAGEEAAAEAQAPAEPEADEGRELAAFSIGGVSVQDASVVWDDRSTGQHYEIKELQLKTGPLTRGEPVEVALEMGLQSQQPPLQGRFELTSRLHSRPEKQDFALENLLVKLNLTGEGLPQDGLDAKLTANVSLDQAQGTLEAQDLRLESGDLVLRANMQGWDLHTKPNFKGSIKLDEFSPRQWLQRFALAVPETSDPEVLKRFSLASGFNATPDLVAFDKLRLQWDQTRIEGELELLQPTDPTYRFALDIDQIDLDRYLPPQPEPRPDGAGSAPPVPPQQASPLFPIELLRSLRLDGKLRIDSLTVNKIKAKAIQLKITAKDGKLQLNEQVGRFYDGKIKGGVDLDVRGKSPILKIDQEATQILIGPLLEDLADMDKLEGTGGFKANLTTSGQTVNELKRGLNGNLDFDFRDGAVKGVNLAKLLRDAKAKLSGETVAVSSEPEQTDFSELSGSGVFNNGILNNQDLLAKSPFLRVDGAGKVNIVAETLDYTVQAVIVNTSKGQGGKELEELEGVPIPVHLEGPWAKPKWRVDLAKVLAEQQKAELKKKLEEKVQEELPGLQEQLPDEVKDKLPGALKGLF
jgi:AsmA protein